MGCADGSVPEPPTLCESGVPYCESSDGSAVDAICKLEELIPNDQFMCKKYLPARCPRDSKPVCPDGSIADMPRPGRGFRGHPGRRGRRQGGDVGEFEEPMLSQ